MTEQELRALVRDAIAKNSIAQAGRTPIVAAAALIGGAEAPPYKSSHALFTLPPGDPEGRCMIEPGVACNHCGYCKSYGH